jgi:Mitochondrial carrier protein
MAVLTCAVCQQCVGAAASLAAVVTTPFDVVKTKQQTAKNGKSSSIVQCLVKVSICAPQRSPPPTLIQVAAQCALREAPLVMHIQSGVLM